MEHFFHYLKGRGMGVEWVTFVIFSLKTQFNVDKIVYKSQYMYICVKISPKC